MLQRYAWRVVFADVRQKVTTDYSNRSSGATASPRGSSTGFHDPEDSRQPDPLLDGILPHAQVLVAANPRLKGAQLRSRETKDNKA